MTKYPPPSVELKAVLLDSGGVLMQPIGGRWTTFEQTVLSRAPHITAARFDAAIAAGERFMDTAAGTSDYTDYLRVILLHLGVDPDPVLLADLVRPRPAALMHCSFDALLVLMHHRRISKAAPLTDASGT